MTDELVLFRARSKSGLRLRKVTLKHQAPPNRAVFHWHLWLEREALAAETVTLKDPCGLTILLRSIHGQA